MSFRWLSPTFITVILAVIWQTLASAASFSGQVKSTTDAYTSNLSSETDNVIPYLSVDLNGKHKFSRSTRTQWRLLTMSNLVADGGPENFYIDLPEAFIEKKIRKFKLRAGMNTLNWGVVDVSSPSDQINTSALMHPLRSLKRGAPMLEASWDREAVALDLVYIPIQRRPLLPSTDSRWLPRKVLLNLDSELGPVYLPDPLTYEYQAPVDLKNSLINTYGGKFSSHLGSVDLQITHIEGAATSPKLRGDFTGAASGLGVLADTPIHVGPVNYRVRTTGFGFTWAREKWIYRAETAYQATVSDTDGYELQPWSWSNVAAIETNIDAGTSSITVLGQFYYTRNPQAADNSITSTYRLFDRTAILGARWQYSEKSLLTLSSLLETRTSGLYWSASFERKFNDSFRWALSWRDFSAPRDGLIKTFERNDHATLDLTWFF